MDSLLPYYEEELAALKVRGREFADRYPRIAAGLRLSDEGCDDPHIERLIQSVAMLTGRVASRLDDDYAGFAAKLLDAIYPHYKRPFPACAIAQFTQGAFGGQLHERSLVHAGPPSVATRHRFTTVYSVDTNAPDVVSATFHPAGVLRERSGESYVGPHIALAWRGPSRGGFRLFVDGDASLAACIRDALGLAVRHVLVPDPADARYVVAGGSIQAVGLDDDSCVLNDPASTHPGFRLLREFFAFPEKFAFFDLRLSAGQGDAQGDGRAILLIDPAATGDGRALQSLSAHNLLTRCAPLVNAFSGSMGIAADAHVRSTIDIDPRFANCPTGGLVAIESIVGTHQDTQETFDIPHFFAVRREDVESEGVFWISAGENVATGAEQVMFVDDTFKSVEGGFGVSVALLCSEGDRPSHIVCGTHQADLYPSNATSSLCGRLVTRPSVVSKFAFGKQETWRLVSQLAMTQTSLLEPSGSVLKELFRLYMPPGSAWSAQVTRALVAVRQIPITRWLPGSFPPTLARGTEIELAVDETQLVGIGLHGLVRVLDAFFSLYAQVNSFIQLVITSSHTGREVHRCALRTGSGPLI
jgi:type VI secretion system protein ImpG